MAAKLRDLAHRRKLPFREVVNSVLRRGLAAQELLHSADADFGRFPGLRWRDPLA